MNKIEKLVLFFFVLTWNYLVAWIVEKVSEKCELAGGIEDMSSINLCCIFVVDVGFQ